MIGPKGDWNRAATSRNVLTAIPLNKWAIFFPRRNMNEVQAFCQTMIQQARRIGIEIAGPKVVPLDSDRNETYISELKKLISPGVQLVLTIFPQMKADRYAAVKR